MTVSQKEFTYGFSVAAKHPTEINRIAAHRGCSAVLPILIHLTIDISHIHINPGARK
jgi:hypothetical protein